MIPTALLGLISAVCLMLVYSMNTWLPELMRRVGYEAKGSLLALLLMIVALAGLGTSGTQTLIYAFVANYYRTNVRGAAVAWAAGFGRLGGVGGPLLGGFLIAAGLALNSIFYVLAGLCLLGLVLTLLVPVARREVTAIKIEPATLERITEPQPVATSSSREE